jgi:putative N6-adenine-specific DNA methylase
MYKVFLVVPPGIESVAKKEVSQLFPDLTSTNSSDSLEYDCDLATIYRLNLNLRVPNRILVRFAEFNAKTFKELFDNSVRLPWKQFLKKDVALSIRTTCHKSKLYHSGAVTQRIHQAIESNLSSKFQLIKNEEAEQIKKQQLIVVRLSKDNVTISIDSSGNPLHMRGYREIVSKAPLRENLAASLILHSGWNASQPLIDPFCGSGTIPIEAALIAKNQAPGLYRDFAFENWPGFKQSDWQDIRKEQISSISADNSHIFGSDRDLGTISIAEENAKKAKVESAIVWNELAISDIIATEQPGWIITNPPYGLRVNTGKDIRNLYARFGNVLRERFSGWEIIFLCNDLKLATQTKLNLKSLLSFTNGGINVQAFYAKIQ